MPYTFSTTEQERGSWESEGEAFAVGALCKSLSSTQKQTRQCNGEEMKV